MSGGSRTRYAVLGALSTSPMSGYDVKCALEATVGHFWRESFGQIYPILRQLVAEGLATVDTERAPGRPERHVYSVTPQGLAELNRWLAEPVGQHQPPRHELLLKLFFGSNLPPEVSLGLVERHREEIEALLGMYGEVEAELRRTPADCAQSLPYWLATLRYGQLTAQATLRWCDETAKLLWGLSDAHEGAIALDGDPARGSESAIAVGEGLIPVGGSDAPGADA